MGHSEMMTPTEVAKWLETSDRTLANWRSTGIGPRFVKVGSNVRYRSGDVEAWLEARTVASTQEAQLLR